MINLQQIKDLESRVDTAVGLIERLRKENAALKGTLSGSQKKIKDLEALVRSFKDDQEEIEGIIVSTLTKLERLGDEVSGKAKEKPAQALPAKESQGQDGPPGTVRAAGEDKAEKDENEELDIF